MITIVGRRESGRSTQLAAAAATDPDGFVVVLNHINALHMVQQCPALRYRVFSIDQVRYGSMRGRQFRNVYVDDADQMPEEAMTLLKERWKINGKVLEGSGE